MKSFCATLCLGAAAMISVFLIEHGFRNPIVRDGRSEFLVNLSQVLVVVITYSISLFLVRMDVGISGRAWRPVMLSLLWFFVGYVLAGAFIPVR